MSIRRLMLVRMIGLLTGVIFGLLSAPEVLAQQPAVPSGDPAATIRTETRLVLVDTVVTDKNGEYVRDLTAKDFRLWEDNKEQNIKSFSFESDNGAATISQQHYLVLFFDNSTMDAADQMRARQAAAKFIESNASAQNLMAVVDFGGTVRIAQNFTTDSERLKRAVANVKFSSLSPNPEVASLGMPMLLDTQADFGTRTVMLALRSMAKSLSSVPGRKSLIFLTTGFPMTAETNSELTAVIDSCNKANVAVYPIDVRGLMPPITAIPRNPTVRRSASASPAGLQAAVLHNTESSSPYGAPLMYVQHPVGGGGPGTGSGHSGGGLGGGTAGGGRSGGGTSGGGKAPGGSVGGRAGSGGPNVGRVGTTNVPLSYPAFSQPRQIVPPFPPAASTNQQVLYALATGTGGFVIANSNDLVAGMQKIAHDQGHYYVLGYTPPQSQEGSCHTLRVKVDRGGTVIRSRSGYCNVKPVDLLAGKTEGKELESRVAGLQPGNIAGSLTAPFFYAAPNIARVNLAMEIPSENFKFSKEKAKQHAALNVLGIAYKPDGSVGARFSDTVNLDFADKKQVEEFKRQPFHYENQFDIASGQYTLKVAFSVDQENFGKIEASLAIDGYDTNQFGLSAMAFSKQIRPVSEMETHLDSMLLENRTPLVAQGMELIPTSDTHFKKNDPAAIYVEIYEPLLIAKTTPPANAPKVGLKLDFVDLKTGEHIRTGYNAQSSVREGSPVVPVGFRIPLDKLGTGSYRVQLTAVDSAGNASKPRSADFDVE
ncbi:MAG: VWA domain-containing protein [Acidobacteria bacterium]|nr:VWA domain-containing protein [Acidobacteriota bacterium]